MCNKKSLTLTLMLGMLSVGAFAQDSSGVTNQRSKAAGSTAQSETTNNTAGSVAGNSGTIGSTPGQTAATPEQRDASKSAAPTASSTGAAKDAAPTNGAMGANTANTTGDTGSSASWEVGSVDPATLRSQIESAFQSDPTLSNSNLHVNVTDSEITVTGTVPSGKEKQTARRIAQSYGANRKVLDKIEVQGRSASTDSGASSTGNSTSVMTGQGADTQSGTTKTADPKSPEDKAVTPR